MLVFLTIFSFPLDSYLKFSSSYYALLIQNINPILHIRCKLIQVIPTQQPNRVLIHKPSHIRLVIPEEVVMQPSLAVGILVLQAKGLVCAIRSPGFLFQTTSMLTANEIVKEQIVQTTSKKVLRSSEKRKPRANRLPPYVGIGSFVQATAYLLSRKVNYSTVSAASFNQIWIDSIGFNFFARIVFV